MQKSTIFNGWPSTYSEVYNIHPLHAFPSLCVPVCSCRYFSASSTITRFSLFKTLPVSNPYHFLSLFPQHLLISVLSQYISPPPISLMYFVSLSSVLSTIFHFYLFHISQFLFSTFSLSPATPLASTLLLILLWLLCVLLISNYYHCFYSIHPIFSVQWHTKHWNSDKNEHLALFEFLVTEHNKALWTCYGLAQNKMEIFDFYWKKQLKQCFQWHKGQMVWSLKRKEIVLEAINRISLLYLLA